MSPDAARLEMSSAFVLPVQRQAMLDEDCLIVGIWMQNWKLSQQIHMISCLNWSCSSKERVTLRGVNSVHNSCKCGAGGIGWGCTASSALGPTHAEMSWTKVDGNAGTKELHIRIIMYASCLTQASPLHPTLFRRWPSTQQYSPVLC
jgi:hypothetical protein